MDASERQARRRDQLVAAGFALMGGDGAKSVTMRGVSREAGLTERYFYESFANREALLIAVLDATVEQAREVLLAAAERAPAQQLDAVRYLVGAFTEFVTSDPRRGRVLFIESLAAPELAERGRELVAEFTVTIAALMRGAELGGEQADEQDVRLNALAIFGSLAQLYQAWLEERIDVPRERFVEHVSQVIESAGRATSR
ncbi:TetR/AcrR family transcriptional regulator [Saccharopolyspora gloriosae]|uniref:AcrR family transcriptional regulator n=1 Tax=Saccharopolyspora gloriosae TaxID=455344 RepID=A0A840NP89_9PSEU|nr:AcrR family transcriptional regulator [Saccharopolyspora gloriosae]